MTKRAAVLSGGRSAEREVSLVSGAGAAAALARKGYDVVRIDPAEPDWMAALIAAQPDFAFNALHGPWGEDGRIQGVLEYLGVPYTHSGVLASALAMDKAKAKAVLAQAGLDTPLGRLAPRSEAAGGHFMAPPYVVKPNDQGSSVGVFIVRQGDNRPPAALTDPAWSLGDLVLVEEFVPGHELTVAVMGEQGALAVTEILPAAAFYDYDAKYAPGGSRHVLPADIPVGVSERALRAAAIAHGALGCRGLTRSDFRYDPAKDRLAILEVNTQPGMTATSLAPEQAAYRGIAYDDLVAWMAEEAFCPR